MNISLTPTTHVTLDLLAWSESGDLELSPKFQRRPVWKPAAKSYFIDSLLRGYPIPPIHVRLGFSSRGTARREIIDGQQRLRAVFDFINGRFKLAKSLDAAWAGKGYSDLTPEETEALMMYKFHAFQYDTIDDSTVLEVFARINTYSVGLNKQELRNGQYFGAFKNAMYDLGRTHLTFWRESKLFTETAIARMLEVELTSELSILFLDGMQDKKAAIDAFYGGLDEKWDKEAVSWGGKRREVPRQYLSRADTSRRFNETLEHVIEIAGNLISGTEFRRVPLFYTLFAVVAHHLYGLPGIETPSPQRRLTEAEALNVRDAIARLSPILSTGSRPEELPSWQRVFLVASSRQTDNIGPRSDRFTTLWDQSELGQ